MTEMPTWPELELPYGLLYGNRIAANALVRSAVFSTLEFSGGAERRAITEPLLLPSIAPYRISQVAGVRLSQSDADVFFWLLSQAYRSGAPRGEAKVCFKVEEALTALGRARGGKTSQLLEQCLPRLYEADFLYEVPNLLEGRSRLISCVERVTLNESTYEYKVTIADGLASLLADGQWLTLLGSERDKLAGEPLGRGLHAFYASHRTAYPMLPETLKGLMGRESMQDSKWLRALDSALAKVKAATGWTQCERLQSGPLAGKVVVTKAKIRRIARNRKV